LHLSLAASTNAINTQEYHQRKRWGWDTKKPRDYMVEESFADVKCMLVVTTTM